MELAGLHPRPAPAGYAVLRGLVWAGGSGCEEEAPPQPQAPQGRDLLPPLPFSFGFHPGQCCPPCQASLPRHPPAPVFLRTSRCEGLLRGLKQSPRGRMQGFRGIWLCLPGLMEAKVPEGFAEAPLQPLP